MESKVVVVIWYYSFEFADNRWDMPCVKSLGFVINICFSVMFYISSIAHCIFFPLGNGRVQEAIGYYSDATATELQEESEI